jgi:SAM-dependent methyltransferase
MEMRQGGNGTQTGKGFSYNDEVGRWWLERSAEAAHRRAYRNIADFIKDSFARPPGMIVDYACGAGNLLALLSCRFPHSKLVGLDGSLLLLGSALQRFTRLPRSCSRRISLIETSLPNFDLLRGKADLVIFCFPNMVPSFAEEKQEWGSWLDKNDREIAGNLAFPEDPYILEQSRCISLNLRRLLARDGICVRVEYATVQRHELSLPELTQVSFEEGSLDYEAEGILPRQWFRLLASAYFRSKVLEDVYQQTADERDRNGGYLITVLRAV